MKLEGLNQDERYTALSSAFSAAIERIAGAYELQPDLRPDLIQDMHVALWQSLARYDGRCSPSTWVFRVAHNVASSYAIKRRRQRRAGTLTLEEAGEITAPDDVEASVHERRSLDRLMALIRRLAEPDRQIALLYLEDLDAAAISQVVGMSPGAVATKIHRLKTVLAKMFQQGVTP
ncbi:sigma-70 family RNA polymerase sigma factor [Nitrospirillum sp. BR 11752]|uniref:RNA polymerase sigma factor n=1 Tax=Nitrospirillum sp. BR 11752 TaxID=3104293 RepID=UPI002EAF6C3B|nr:sigma-70 family RNA polymerase sigma factor [Nitrospirillum sp. BR 11752]